MMTRYQVAKTADGSVRAWAVRDRKRWVPIVEVAGKVEVEAVGGSGRRGYRYLVQAWKAAQERFAELTDA